MNDSRTALMRQIASAIRPHRRFLVATHIRPDGDAAGSLLATTFMLRKLGKRADAYCQDELPPGHGFLQGSETILHGNVQVGDYDAVILVDCGEPHRVGPFLAEQLPHAALLINIDHHVSSAPFGDVYWVDAEASSTCEMLYDLAPQLPVTLDSAIASQLYTGILMDTGSFRFANTNQRVLEIAARLVNAGAQPAFIAEQVYDSNSANRLRLLCEVLSTLTFHADNRLAAAEITQEMYTRTQTSPVDSEAFINQLRSVKTVRLAIIFREEIDGIIYASLRSKGEVDVASFAQKYGGGGHRHAAALRISGSLAGVRRQIVEDAMKCLPAVIEK
jgi:phosphoesterase RecJ-like protein